MNKDGIPDIPPEELEMAIEDFTGKDTKGSPEQRIEALQKRIIYLREQLRCLLLDMPPADVKLTDSEEQRFLAAEKVSKDLAAAREQLARYQALKEGRN